MGRAMRLAAEGQLHEHSGDTFGIAAGSRFGKAITHVDSDLAVAIHGRPVYLDSTLAATAAERGVATAAAEGWTRFGAKLPTRMSGSFALAVLQPSRKRALLALDRVGI